MKKILIICYAFPPCSFVGGRRPYFFAKYLQQAGYELQILTNDMTFEKKWEWDVPIDNFDIIKIKKKNIFFKLNFFQKLILKIHNKINSFFLKKITDNICKIFLPIEYDINWDYDFEQIRSKIKKPDYIIASAGPWFIFQYAVWLNSFYNSKLIFDYRDVWNGNNKEVELKSLNHNGFFLKGIILKKIFFNLEKKLIKKCTAVITVSEDLKKNITSFTSKPIHVIYNGFDEIENIKLIKNDYIKNDYFNILYGGNIRIEQDLDIFIEGIKKIKEKYPEINNKIQFFFIGSMISHNNAICKILNLKWKNIEITDFIPKNEFLNLYNNANLLLQISYKDKKGIISSKIFQYLNSNKPILLVSNTEDCMEQLIRETNSGFICKTSEEITDCIIQSYFQWKNDGKVFYEPDYKKINEYSFENQTKKLIKIIENL